MESEYNDVEDASDEENGLESLVHTLAINNRTADTGWSDGLGTLASRGSRSPLRATLPVELMMTLATPHPRHSRRSPDIMQTSSRLVPDLSPTRHTGLGWARASTTAGVPGDATTSAVTMRRTASLDTIHTYLKGQWTHTLQLDKACQTPEDWSCQGKGNEDWGGVTARLPPPAPFSSPPPTPPATEQIEKFIRQRLQRTSKDHGKNPGMQQPAPVRCSPVLGTGRATTAGSPHTPIHTASPGSGGACSGGGLWRGGGSPAPTPPPPRPLLPRFRNSVEGLNQEIERLVLRPAGGGGATTTAAASSSATSLEYERVYGGGLTPDGRRAPMPDFMRMSSSGGVGSSGGTRSVNTQTPAASTAGCDEDSSCSPPPPLLQPQNNSTSSPVEEQLTLKVSTSPHINKFLAREPPDGCERVSLRHSEEFRPEHSQIFFEDRGPTAASFTLRPSLGSAFCPPAKLVSSSSDEVLHLQQQQQQQQHNDQIPPRLRSGSGGGGGGGSGGAGSNLNQQLLLQQQQPQQTNSHIPRLYHHQHNQHHRHNHYCHHNSDNNNDLISPSPPQGIFPNLTNNASPELTADH